MRDLPSKLEPGALFPAGLRVAFSSRDPDEMSERSPYWGLDELQLGSGRFEGIIRAVHSGRVQLNCARRNTGSLIQGSIPSEAVVLASVRQQAAPVLFRGVPIADHQLLWVRQPEGDRLSGAREQRIDHGRGSCPFVSRSRAGHTRPCFFRWQGYGSLRAARAASEAWSQPPATRLAQPSFQPIGKPLQSGMQPSLGTAGARRITRRRDGARTGRLGSGAPSSGPASRVVSERASRSACVGGRTLPIDGCAKRHADAGFP